MNTIFFEQVIIVLFVLLQIALIAPTILDVYELKAIFADEGNLKPWERLKLLSGEQ